MQRDEDSDMEKMGKAVGFLLVAALATFVLIVAVLLVMPGKAKLLQFTAYGLFCSLFLGFAAALSRKRMVRTSGFLSAASSACLVAMAYFVGTRGLRPPPSLLAGRILLGAFLLAMSALPWLIGAGPKMHGKMLFDLARAMKRRWKYALVPGVPLFLAFIVFFKTEAWIELQISVTPNGRKSYERTRYKDGSFDLGFATPEVGGFLYFDLSNVRKVPMTTRSPEICRLRFRLLRPGRYGGYARYEDKKRRVCIEECRIQRWDGSRVRFAITIHDVGPDHTAGTDDDTKIEVSSRGALCVKTWVVNFPKLVLAARSFAQAGGAEEVARSGTW